jgi:L,D-transpeptidase-like protein
MLSRRRRLVFVLAAPVALGVGMLVREGSAPTSGPRAATSGPRAPTRAPPAARAAAASAAASLAEQAAVLPRAPRPAFSVSRPVLLRHARAVSRWAPVVRRIAVHAAPRARSPRIAELEPETPEGTTNLVLVLGEAERAGELWVHARLPILPNNRTGWIPRRALGGYHFVHTHLVVSLEHLTATLLYDGKAIFRAPVGVGRPYWPTPRGEFYVREKLTRFRSPFYGPLAFGTSARSSALTDWPDGGFIGIHGTNQPELLPARVSHGCIRMRNEDIVRLGRLLPVGTPLTIL